MTAASAAQPPVHRLDDDLFVGLACWVAPRLAVPSWGGLLLWLDEWLDEDAARALRADVVLLDDRDQREAETRLIAFLGTSAARESERCRVSDAIERSVDWPRTYIDLDGVRGGTYWTRERTPTEDADLVLALETLGRTWSTLLARDAGANPDHRERSIQLTRVCRDRAVRFVAYGSHHSRRLQSYGEKGRTLAAALERVSDRWSRRLQADDPGWRREVGARLRSLAESAHRFSKNADLVLELSTRLAIMKTALVAPGEARWELDEPIGFPRSAGTRQPGIVLRRRDLRCRISKGRPAHVVGGLRREGIDRLVSVARDGCGLNATGNQPDIVLCFWSTTDPGRAVFALGDAKRNDAGDGTNYLRSSLEVGAAYCVSYGHLLGMTLGGAPTLDAALTTDVDPPMTLFCLQGAPASDELAPARLEERLRAHDRRMPLVLALDVGRHFSPDDSADDRPRPVLHAWFERLASQAARVLDSGGGSMLRDGPASSAGRQRSRQI